LLWVLLLVFVPWLTAIVYLIVGALLARLARR